jgi:hydrogenase/urease accessory protein HupE
MRRFILFILTLGICAFAAHMGFAQDAADKASEPSTTEAIKETASNLAKDLKKARDIILDGAGDNPFGRGFMIALFEPVFLASMFCLGLWAGQMDEKIKNIWALPVVAFAATVIGAFITAYHSDWKPDFTDHKLAFLADLESTDAVAVVVGLMFGGAVGLGYTVPPLMALTAVGAAGLALGFSQTNELGAHKNALLPFWTGFGLTGLLINIFGIGFETFMQSINLSTLTRWIGLGTVALSVLMGSKVF